MNPTNRQLAERIDSLLALDERGALVPHGLGGLARSLLLQSSSALKGLRKIEAHVPADLYALIQRDATERGCTPQQACRELYCEGHLCYSRKAEVYDMAETVDRWTARYAQYTGEPGTVYMEVNAKRAQSVHDMANHHNMVTPSMNSLMLAVGLWASLGLPL
jgi:hypothetical protein